MASPVHPYERPPETKVVPIRRTLEQELAALDERERLWRRLLAAFLVALLAAFAFALEAPAQVRILDDQILLDSGKTLDQAIADGDFGSGPGGTGNVVGPVSSTVGAVAAWANTSGTLLRDTTPAESVALLRAWFGVAHVVDVDPSTDDPSRGIDAAINACPSGGDCMVNLRCNADYAFKPRSAGGVNHYVDVTANDDVWIRGCGSATVVSLVDDTTTQRAVMFLVGNGSGVGADRLRLTDFTMRRVQTCTGNCSGDVRAMVYDAGSTNDLTIERMRFEDTRTATADSTTTNQLIGWTDAATGLNPNGVSRGTKIANSYFQTAQRGWAFSACDQCTVTGNVWNFLGRPIDTTGPGTANHISIKHGNGYTVTGNSLDVSWDNDGGSNPGISAIFLDLHGNPALPESNSNGASVTGNTITGLRGASGVSGILLVGYNEAVVEGNSLEAGQCSGNALLSCSDNDDCTPSSGTCVASATTGINLLAGALDNQAGNRDNLFASIGFRGFQDDDALVACPVRIDSVGTDPLENTRNRFKDLRMSLADPADDGFCGDSTKIAANYIGGTIVAGATSSCLEGFDLASCGILYTWASKLTTLASLSVTTAATVPTVATTNDSTAAASTAWVENVLAASAAASTGGGLFWSAGNRWFVLDSSEGNFLQLLTTAAATNGALVVDTNGDNANLIDDLLGFFSGGELFNVPACRGYPTSTGMGCLFNASTDRLEWTIPPAGPAILKSLSFPGYATFQDGTQCAAAAPAAINGGPVSVLVSCADSSSGIVFGDVDLPDAYDGGSVVFVGTGYSDAGDPAGVLAFDCECQIRASSAAPSSTWGSPVAVDLDFAPGDRATHDLVMAASASATCNGAADVASQRLYWRCVVDSGTSSATPLSATAASSDYFLHSMKVEYTAVAAGD